MTANNNQTSIQASADVRHGALAESFDEFMQAFEAFKTANDERLSELEANGAADPLLDDKLTRIENQLGTYEAAIEKMARPAMGGSSQDDYQRKTALDAYLRKGKADQLMALEAKGMNVGSEADGGYLVPEETESELMARMRDKSPIRSLASNLVISTSEYKRPFAVSGAGAGWVAETGLRPETASPQLAETTFPTMELYAAPAATKRLLDDAHVDIEAFLMAQIDEAFAEQETNAFVNGDGSTKPTGFLTYPQADYDNAPWGTIGTIGSGAAGDITADGMFDMVYSLGAKHRRNATFLMNRMTLSTVRKLKAADGTYLMQPRLDEGFANTLLGFPIVECEDLPNIAADATPIVFADFKRAYLIVDRAGVQILRDPFSAKPYVVFYATKRVGGGVLDFGAIRLLRC
ncbi:MAG: phage major capsid protein [Pseudomonadota bacterium]